MISNQQTKQIIARQTWGGHQHPVPVAMKTLVTMSWMQAQFSGSEKHFIKEMGLFIQYSFITLLYHFFLLLFFFPIRLWRRGFCSPSEPLSVCCYSTCLAWGPRAPSGDEDCESISGWRLCYTAHIYMASPLQAMNKWKLWMIRYMFGSVQVLSHLCRCSCAWQSTH